VPAPTINIPVPVTATAFGEALHLEFEIDVSADGQHFVSVWARGHNEHPLQLLLRFDAYEWARLQKALAGVDELLRKIEKDGATFKIG